MGLVGAGLSAWTLTQISSRTLGQKLQQGREGGELLRGQLTELHSIARQHSCKSLQSHICWEPDTELRAGGEIHLWVTDG